MKTHLALMLSCASVMGADTGIQVNSTTDQTGGLKTEVFTRDGQTNLVCDTRTKDGALITRIQTFYHDGSKIGASITMTAPDSQDYKSEAGSPYSLTFRVSSPHDSGFVYVRARDGSYVDMFTCTNGVYYPVGSNSIAQINRAMEAYRHARGYAAPQTHEP